MNRFIFLISFLLVTSLFSNTFDKTYKVMVLKEWKPYYLIDKNGKPDGYAIELFEKLANNIGLKYEYVIVDTWKEGITLLKAKKIDIVPNLGIAMKRASYANFTQTTDLFEIGLFKHKSLQELKTLKDSSKHTVGVLETNVGNKLVTNEMVQTKIVFKNYYRALSALENREIDVLCYPRRLVEQSIKELELKNLEPFGHPLKVVSRGIAVVKGEEKLVELLDKELLIIKGNGEFQEIYDNWFGLHKDIEINFEQLGYFLLVLLVVILIVLYFIRNNNLILTKKELENKINEIEDLKNEQIEQQRILMTQSKVAAVGEMLGNIAHQWRQPLSVIAMEVNTLKADIELGENITNEMIIKSSDVVLNQAKYLSKTIDDFRYFFSTDVDSINKYNLKDALKRLEELTKGMLLNNFIRYRINIQDDITINSNESIFIQALINILNNSKDALKKNIEDTSSRYLFIDVIKKDDMVSIIIKDSGGGINESIIDKIFEPYFTTKDKAVGTGIGLYMTNQIITKQLKGTIEAKNVKYEYEDKKLSGAEFKIEIPI